MLIVSWDLDRFAGEGYAIYVSAISNIVNLFL